MNKKLIYEWVIVSSKGEENIYLTENQYKFYMDHRDEGTVDFDDCSINPSFVVKTFKQIAEVVNQKYKCKECYGNGTLYKGEKPEECPVCKGTGVDYGKV